MKLDLILKAVKEPMREIFLASLPGVLLYLEKLNTTWAVVLYLILRGIDSWLHESSKVKTPGKRNEGLFGIKGLTGF